MFWMPLRFRSNFCNSLPRMRASFLSIAPNSPESRMRWYSCILPTRFEIVWKLVSMPPNQRWFT